MCNSEKCLLSGRLKGLVFLWMFLVEQLALCELEIDPVPSDLQILTVALCFVKLQWFRTPLHFVLFDHEQLAVPNYPKWAERCGPTGKAKKGNIDKHPASSGFSSFRFRVEVNLVIAIPK